MSRRQVIALAVTSCLLAGGASARLASVAPPRPHDDAAAIATKVLTSPSLPGLTRPFISDVVKRLLAWEPAPVATLSKGRTTVSPPAVLPTPENLAHVEARSLFIRQKPGPTNSLGLATFIFPNDGNVYMHGTPAQQLLQARGYPYREKR